MTIKDLPIGYVEVDSYEESYQLQRFLFQFGLTWRDNNTDLKEYKEFKVTWYDKRLYSDSTKYSLQSLTTYYRGLLYLYLYEEHND